MSAAVQLAGHSGYLASAGALLVLDAALDAKDDSLIGFCRARALAELRALQAQGASGAWLHCALSSLADESISFISCTYEVDDCLRALKELMRAEAMAELLATRAQLRDGAAPILGDGSLARPEDVSWTCWARSHTKCSGSCIPRGTCLCACHARAAAPASRHASPPPPSGDGDEEALERAAACGCRDTLPPSGEVELGETACRGADTEPPASVQWWDDIPTVRC